MTTSGGGAEGDEALAAARRRIDALPLARALGFEVVRAEPGRNLFRLRVDERHLNPNGVALGAALFALADISMGFAAASACGMSRTCASIEAKTTVPFFGSTTVDDSEFSLMMRIGGGAWFNVNPTTKIGASLEFDPYFGDFDQTTFIVQAGAMLRM